MPNLRFLDASTQADPARLALGITPRQLGLYPIADGRFQLLWLDQTLPGDIHLIGGTLAPDHTLERGPVEISHQSTLDYSAIPAPSGNVLILWTALETGNNRLTSIYAQTIDNMGRLRSPERIAASGRYPHAIYDLQGNLHIAWMQAETGYLWTIHYVMFPADKQPTETTSTVISVVKLATDEAFEAFSFGADATHLYCLWDIVRAGRTVNSSLAGLAFPLGDITATHSLKLDMPGVTLRWPVFPNRTNRTLHVSFSAARNNDAVPTIPVIAALTPEGITAAESVLEQTNNQLISKTALAIDDRDNLYLAWSALSASGKTEAYYATNHP